MRHQGSREPERLPGYEIGIVLPLLRLTVHGKSADMYAGVQVIGAGRTYAWSARFVDIDEQPDHRISQGVRAVIDIGDLLTAPDRAVGGHGIDGDRISCGILPVVLSGPAIQGAGAFFISPLHIAGYI